MDEATALTQRGRQLGSVGRYVEARDLHARALAIRRAALGDSLPVAANLQDLADVLDVLGQAGSAEPLHREALGLWEKLSPPGAAEIGEALNRLGRNLIWQGRPAEAEPLLRRAMAILAADGATLERAFAEINWGKALVDTGATDRGAAAYRDALAIMRPRLPAGHRRIIEAATGLAITLAATDDAASLALLREILAQESGTLGEDHPDLVSTLVQVGQAMMQQGDMAGAAPLMERAASLAGRTLPADHRDNIEAQMALARLLYATRGGDRTRADALLAAAMAGADARLRLRIGLDRAAQRDRRDLSGPFDLRLDADALMAMQEGWAVPAWRDDAFLAAQRAGLTVVGRSTAGIGPLAEALRRRERLAMARDVADREDIAALAAGQDRAGTSARRAKAERALADADAALAALAPRASALEGAAPIELPTLQALLADDEAMLYVRTVADASYVWLITRDGARWFREARLGRAPLTALVARLRPGGDPEGRGQLGTSPPSPFDRAAARALHDALIAPVADQLQGRHRLLIAGNGPLAALPLGLLVDRQGGWLGERWALAALPAPAMLATLRCTTAACLPRTRRRGLDLLALSETNPAGDRAAQAWRAALPAIAAMEVPAALSRFAPAARSIEHVGESTVRTDPALSTADYLLFAAHALTAGPGGEPGLVLAPGSDGGDPANDGFLSASEAAALDLSAHLVLLSACDSGASDGTPDGEAFSGLVHGFLIAGARSVVASQWRVSDAATAALMAALLDRLRAGSAPADALREAMRLVRESPDGRWADPRYWAGFTLVGDGG